MKPIPIAIAVFIAAALVAGCSRSATVNTEQDKADFISATQESLKNLESRVDKVKAQSQGREMATATVLESSTEMAEEQIETIRNTQIPALQEATDEQKVAQFREDIRRALQEATRDVDRAETTLAAAKDDREKFAESVRSQLRNFDMRLTDVRTQAKALSEETVTRISAMGEMIEEGIEEADKALKKHRDAEDNESAKVIRNDIEGLMGRTAAKLNEAETIAIEAIAAKRDDYLKTAQIRWDDLHRRLVDVRRRVEELTEGMRPEITAMGDEAEQYLTEASSGLVRYKEARPEKLDEIGKEVDSWLTKTVAKLDEAEDALQKAFGIEMPDQASLIR